MKKREFIGRIFRDTASASPWRFGLQYGLTLVNALASAGIPRCTQSVYECAAAGGVGIFWALGRLFVLYAISQSALYASIYISQAYDTRCIQYRYRDIHRKIGRLPPESFQRPEVLNCINGAYLGAEQVRPAVHGAMELLTFYIPYFLVYSVYLCRICPQLWWILPAVFLPTAGAQLLKSGVFSELEEKAAPIRRQSECYGAYTGEANFAKETRQLGAVPFFLRKYRLAREAMNRLLLDARRKAFTMETAAAILNLLGYIGAVIVLLRLCMAGRIQAAAFAAVFTSLGTVNEYSSELLSEKLKSMVEAFGELRQYYRFFSLEESGQADTAPDNLGEISLEQVSYFYPDSNAPALQNINLCLHPGETLALVGENGSGKTTLSKVLLGLYVPTSGKVTRGGVPGESLGLNALCRRESAVFQNFGKYPMTVGENIALGAEVKCGDAMRSVGMQLPEDMQLGREFGGGELSGGQWQRLAIARGMAKTGAVLALDEPTSAIDPMQEHTLYSLFLTMTEGKTGVIATHRLGLARLCSRIAVLERGRLLAVGTHEELLACCPWYKNQWLSQSEQYRQE